MQITHTYTHEFFAECPNNRKIIAYKLVIKTPERIMVEHIVLACALHRQAYHEDIVEAIVARFSGASSVALTAHHHGVDICSEAT